MRLLIVRLSSLGDIVSSMVVLQFIKKKYPDAQIDWLADEKFAEVLADNEDLNKVYKISLKSRRYRLFQIFKEIFKVSKKLGPYDYIIDMQGLIKSALISRLIGKNIIGFDKKSAKEGICSLLYKKKINISFSDHILKRNCALVSKTFDIPINMEMIMRKKTFLNYQKPSVIFSSYLSTKKKNILVVLGGSWPSKKYPKEPLKEVIDRLKQNTLLLWSNDEEYQRASWIASKTPYVTILPKMNLNDVKALIHKVDIVLGNDTGPTHMAWGLNTPSVTILGCTSITRIAVHGKNIAVTSKTCVNPSKIDREDLSINEIPPYEIVDAIESLY